MTVKGQKRAVAQWGRRGRGRLCLVLPGGPPALPLPEHFLRVLCLGVMPSPTSPSSRRLRCCCCEPVDVHFYLATVENASKLFLNSQHILREGPEPVSSEFRLIGRPSPSLHPTVTLQATAQITRSKRPVKAPSRSPVLSLS